MHLIIGTSNSGKTTELLKLASAHGAQDPDRYHCVYFSEGPVENSHQGYPVSKIMHLRHDDQIDLIVKENPGGAFFLDINIPISPVASTGGHVLERLCQLEKDTGSFICVSATIGRIGLQEIKKYLSNKVETTPIWEDNPDITFSHVGAS